MIRNKLKNFFHSVILPEITSRKNDPNFESKEKLYCKCKHPSFMPMIVCDNPLVQPTAQQVSGIVLIKFVFKIKIKSDSFVFSFYLFVSHCCDLFWLPFLSACAVRTQRRKQMDPSIREIVLYQWGTLRFNVSVMFLVRALFYFVEICCWELKLPNEDFSFKVEKN